MAKITRKNMTVFGLNAGFEQIAQFGSLNASAPAFSTDVNTIISLANWQEGWFNAVEATNSPAIEDMNAMSYVFGWQIAYMLQTGVPEWNATTTYYIGSLANDGAGNLYRSKIDNNLNNALTTTADWEVAGFPSLPGAAGYVLSSTGATGIAWTEKPLFQDFSNNRLGVNFVTPQNRIHVDGGNATATYVQWTCGTTTGTTSTSGLAVGVDASGNAAVLNYGNTPINFFANNAAVGNVAAASNWTFGNVATLGTTHFHKFFGSAVSDFDGNGNNGGWYGGKAYIELGANAYRDTSNTIHNLGGTSGVTLMALNAIGSTSSQALQFVAGTSGTSTTNLFAVRGDGLFQIQTAGLLLPSGGDTLAYYNYSANRITAGSFGNTGGTISVSDVFSEVWTIGKTCWITVQCDVTLTGAGKVEITLPFTAATTGVNASNRQIINIVCLADTSTGLCNIDTGTSTTQLFVASSLSNANFSSGSNHTIGFQIAYQTV